MYKLSSDFLDMRKIADSGQVFRFNKQDDKSYSLVADDRYLRIKRVDKGLSDIHTYELDCDEKEYEEFWKSYFDMGTDYSKYIKTIETTDRYLLDAAEHSRGIRILNQDKWEMLISFIISQRKSIPAIKSSIEKMAKYFGKKIKDDIYAFPTPEDIMSAKLELIDACGLGYRKEYIQAAARQVVEGNINLYKWDTLSDNELLEQLKSFRGVGVKVANCVMLFAYHRIGAFPIDVWIERIINENYKEGFPLDRYEGYAGVLQQFMFFYAREMANVKLK